MSSTFARERSRPTHARRGSALVASLVVFVVVAGFVVAAFNVSSVDVRASRRSINDVRATALAEVGIERAKAMFSNAIKKAGSTDPLDGVRNAMGGQPTLDLFLAEPLTSNGASVGEHTTTITLESDSETEVFVRITSSGYVPAAPQNLGPNQELLAWDSIDVTLRYSVAPSNVFDYGYFINNWGWLYGDSINVNGNARSNGQMDLGGYQPTVSGSPIYDEVAFDGTNATVGERLDDGSIWSSWDIVNADNARGMAADTATHHAFDATVPMPNLNDLTVYETRATRENASVSIGGVTMIDGVAGDDVGELNHVYLHGTAANPIQLDGQVVVRGDVIISGYVTGQGSIYAGGNVYVPENIQYVNGPTSPRPTDNTNGAVETWLEDNWNADFLGLFANEHVVVGDFTDTSWQQYVGAWLASPQNASHEDSGEDLIPNTRAGRDGVIGTADDDWLENDGSFSVETYSIADAAAGLIPNGFNVGDPIPGTGEDIDGDGQYDATTTLTDFDFQDVLSPTHWGGNMPAGGIAAYSAISSLYANHLDGTFYTNHAFAWVVFGSQDAVINGAMVARNESIVYGTPSLTINHDARLLGGASGVAGDLLPRIIQPVETVQWRRNEEDPHRAIVTP